MKKNNGTYLETHHINPKCLGGLDNKQNLVNLPAREHFICHLLLTKFNNDPKLIFALHMLANQKDRFGRNIHITSRLYKRIRESYIKNMSIISKGRKAPFKGKGSAPMGTVLNLRKMAEKRRGIKRSEDIKKKISESHHKNHKLKDFIKIKGSNRLNKKHSEQTKLKISNSKKGCIPWNKGKTGTKLSDATKLKMSMAKQKANSIPRIISIKTGEKFSSISDISRKTNISCYFIKKFFNEEYKYL